MSVKGFKFADLTGGCVECLDGQDGDTLSDGDFAMVIKDQKFYPYVLDETSGETESSPDIITPDLNAGDKRWKLARMPVESIVPCGCIMPWVGGYFTNGTNDDYQPVLAETIAEINAYLDGLGYVVCDGSEYNNPDSPIFNGDGRFLPNLTDDRFIMGDTQVGGGRNGSGGDTSQNYINHDHTFSHRHTVDIGSFNTSAVTLTTTQIPAHRHELAYATVSTVDQYEGSKNSFNWDGDYNSGYWTTNVGGSGSHYHSVNPPNTNTSYNDTTRTGITQHDNRPNWLGCVFIMRVL